MKKLYTVRTELGNCEDKSSFVVVADNAEMACRKAIKESIANSGRKRSYYGCLWRVTFLEQRSELPVT